MLDIAITCFVIMFLALGLRRPFIWTLAYLYVDIVSPQRISYNLLTSLQLSMVVFILSVGGWLVFERKEGTRFSFRQVLMVLLLAYCWMTTQYADFPTEAADKWGWVWKALLFAAFLPLTLRSRLRLEAAALIMVLSVGAICISGALKTLASGGGYGSLRLFIDDNTGIYEGSTLSCVAIAIIPLILWLAKNGTIFPTNPRVKLFAAGLIFSCLLIPIGTVARTGLMCAALLGVLMLFNSKKRGMYLGVVGIGLLIAVPLLPTAYVVRMGTIQKSQSDESAETRIAVWKWTLDYVAQHPFGGGFDAYRGNQLHIELQNTDTNGIATGVQVSETTDKARAYHSAYFEMLGEQGWPGLIIWLTLQLTGLFQLQSVRLRLRKSKDPADRRDADLAVALQEGHLVYLFGAAFVGIAYQPFVYMLIGLQIALVGQVRRRQAAQGTRLPTQPAPRFEGAYPAPAV